MRKKPLDFQSSVQSRIENAVVFPAVTWLCTGNTTTLMQTNLIRVHALFYRVAALGGLCLLAAVPGCLAAEPSTAALARYSAYVDAQEHRLAQQHRARAGFVVLTGSADAGARLHRGELVVESMTPGDSRDLPGAMLHHWRATAFVPGATAADLERVLRDVAAYPRLYAPQVVQARVVAQQGDRFRTSMRLRQKHVLTVVLDMDYDVAFVWLDPSHGYSLARSTRVAEIADAGTASEHALSPGDDHGFLWRQNTYWSYAEADGGLYLQIESVSLTRTIPTGLGWALRPFVESVPRESLEFTLRSTLGALHK